MKLRFLIKTNFKNIVPIVFSIQLFPALIIKISEYGWKVKQYDPLSIDQRINSRLRYVIQRFG